MLALNAFYREILTTGCDLTLLERKVIRCVKKQLMTSRLCLFGDAECAICVDIYGLDRVHLKCNFHQFLPSLVFRYRWPVQSDLTITQRLKISQRIRNDLNFAFLIH